MRATKNAKLSKRNKCWLAHVLCRNLFIPPSDFPFWEKRKNSAECKNNLLQCIANCKKFLQLKRHMPKSSNERGGNSSISFPVLSDVSCRFRRCFPESSIASVHSETPDVTLQFSDWKAGIFWLNLRLTLLAPSRSNSLRSLSPGREIKGLREGVHR